MAIREINGKNSKLEENFLVFTDFLINSYGLLYDFSRKSRKRGRALRSRRFDDITEGIQEPAIPITQS